MAGVSPLLLLLCVVSFVNAEWWDVGSPFARSTRPSTLPVQAKPTRQANFGRITQKPCQCVKPEYCRDYYDPSRPTDRRCDIEGDMCCNELRFAEQYDDNDPEDSGTKGNDLESQDIGYYEFSEEPVESPPPVRPTSPPPTRQPTKSSPQVIKLQSVGQNKPKQREPWVCGKPLHQIDEKNAEDTNDAIFSEFPWTLALFEETSFRPIIRCAASLIDPILAVTAAHCLTNIKQEKLIVRAGEYILDSEDENLAYQERRVRKIVIHNEYDSVNLDNDIALLILEEAFTEARHIGTICLPEKEENIINTCFASGWGMRNNAVSPQSQNKMKKAELSFELPDACQEKLRQTDMGPSFVLPGSFICATKAKNGVDTSYLDGGGPFICKAEKEDKYILVGVTSWGKQSYPDAPGVYTSIYLKVDWINNERNQLAEM